ncbi:MAG: hypothetical protein GYA16_08110 [Spirochaetes bacterium]|nr:hypothetical protein [Spirochaetota bacterium]
MDFKSTFNEQIISMLNIFVNEQKKRFPSHEVLTIDLHCHDHNSNIPDEQLGRILGIPETWLPTEDLLTTLKNHGCDTYTVTNHNNARSCYELLDKGHDVLVGAEFSCTVPDYKVGIHVLAYGFTPEKEIKLNKLRTERTILSPIPMVLLLFCNLCLKKFKHETYPLIVLLLAAHFNHRIT